MGIEKTRGRGQSIRADRFSSNNNTSPARGGRAWGTNGKMFLAKLACAGELYVCFGSCQRENTYFSHRLNRIYINISKIITYINIISISYAERSVECLAQES